MATAPKTMGAFQKKEELARIRSVADLFRSRAEQDAQRTQDDENGERVDDPVKTVDERNSGEDRDGPQNERSGDTGEQNAPLILGRNVKLREDHREDEDVVDGER